jgi:hypothetical protein
MADLTSSCGHILRVDDWWIILASGASLLRNKITDHTMGWMNRVAGIAIGGFGLVNVVPSRGRRH